MVGPIHARTTADQILIHLVGPGGAGKSTVGAALAARLGLHFLDLDAAFTDMVGDISRTIEGEGYEAYTRRNVETYFAIADCNGPSVIALSSGFMTYADGLHSQYARIRSEIAMSDSTFVLLPSLDIERCIRETVRRQLTRPFVRSAEKEEAVIRERYGIYMAVPAKKIETIGPLDQVVDQIVARLPPNPRCCSRLGKPAGILVEFASKDDSCKLDQDAPGSGQIPYLVAAAARCDNSLKPAGGGNPAPAARLAIP